MILPHPHEEWTLFSLAGQLIWLERNPYMPKCQGCGFDPWSEHIQESTNECLNKQNNKLTSFFLSQIDKNKKLKNEHFYTFQ